MNLEPAHCYRKGDAKARTSKTGITVGSGVRSTDGSSVGTDYDETWDAGDTVALFYRQVSPHSEKLCHLIREKSLHVELAIEAYVRDANYPSVVIAPEIITWAQRIGATLSVDFISAL